MRSRVAYSHEAPHAMMPCMDLGLGYRASGLTWPKNSYRWLLSPRDSAYMHG